MAIKSIKAPEAVEAVRKANGFVSTAAKNLNISRTQMYNIINKFPTVKEAVIDEREKMKDFAEAQLLANIKGGREASLIFYLKTQAKDRGYVERQEVTGAEGGPISINQWRKKRDDTRLDVAETLDLFDGETKPKN